MDKIKKYIALIAVAASFSSVSFGAVKAVEWTAKLSEKGDKSVLTVSGTIEPGWHIYGFEMPDYGDDVGTPEATTLSLCLPDGIKAVGETEKTGECAVHFDNFMNLNLPWLTGKVAFVQSLAVAPGAKGTIEGTVKYMACGDSACLPPDSYKFSIPVAVRAAAAAPAPAENRAAAVYSVPADKAHEDEAAQECMDIPVPGCRANQMLLSVEIVLLALLGFCLLGRNSFAGRWVAVRVLAAVGALSFALYLLPELFRHTII